MKPEPKASLKEQIDEHAAYECVTPDAQAAYIAGALHGAPIEFAIEALERIAQFDIESTEPKQAHLVAWCSMVAEARGALVEIRKAQGDVSLRLVLG